ncbi:MAG: hypothetical protein Q4C65_05910 [Eubacteriales bacterium]|nr:hypothetical protein [Eubacteriales bacterium]
MFRKKIVFVIVEGPSDEEALGVLLNRIYDSKAVYVHVMHRDLTTELNVNPSNIVSKVGNLVKNYAGRMFKPDDFSQIIHITDMDGVFIPDDAVVEDNAAVKPAYSETEIRTQRKNGIEARNSRKRENLNRLASTAAIWKVPYQIYYMSCNLDHVLYGKLNSTDDEKERDAFTFAKKYRDDIPGFINYISKSAFSVTGGYSQSWQYIREGLHSLERHTNFGLCFLSGFDGQEAES